jgi:hypothetical protein
MFVGTSVTAIAGISATTLCLYPNLPKETNEMKRIEDFEDFEDFEDIMSIISAPASFPQRMSLHCTCSVDF